MVKGFSTALMRMHRGDHWRIYIPYQLGLWWYSKKLHTSL